MSSALRRNAIGAAGGELADYEAGLDALADVVADEEADSGHVEGHEEWDELVGLGMARLRWSPRNGTEPWRRLSRWARRRRSAVGRVANISNVSHNGA